MYTIWFGLDENDGRYLKVEHKNLELAQQVWDKLEAGGFWMFSTRP